MERIIKFYTKKLWIGFCCAALFIFYPLQLIAVEIHGDAMNFMIEKVDHIAKDPQVITAIQAQNLVNQHLTHSDLQQLDQKWRAEREMETRPIIDQLLDKPISKHLKAIKAQSDGMISELFIVDRYGLNVGMSDVTSDYYQGDEAKHTRTFEIGSNAIFISEVAFDESTQTNQIQISTTVTDFQKQPIGSITAGFAVDALKEKPPALEQSSFTKD